MDTVSPITLAASVIILVAALCFAILCILVYRKYRCLKGAIEKRKAEMEANEKEETERAEKRQRAIERNRELEAGAAIERKARDVERFAAKRRERIELAKVSFYGYDRSGWQHGAGYSAAGIQMYYDKYADDLVETREQLTATPIEDAASK